MRCYSGMCAFVGYIFVTRKQMGGLLAVGYGLHLCNTRIKGWCVMMWGVYVCGVIELKRSIMWCSALGCLLLVS